MRCVPTQKNRRAVTGLIATLLLFGAVTYSIPVICRNAGIKTIPILFTSLTFIAVIAAVSIAVRYLMTGYEYVIRPNSDLSEDDAEAVPEYDGAFEKIPPDYLDLIVSKSQGSRPGYMDCVLSLGDLKAVIPVSRKGKITPRTVRNDYSDEKFVFYNYTLTFHWQNAVECIFEDGDRCVGIILEADEQMSEYLKKLCP